MKTLSMGLLLISALLVGCAEKKPPRPKIPLKLGTNIEFRGIKDGHCSVADVFIDAQTGDYVVICK